MLHNYKFTDWRRPESHNL